MIRFIVLLSCMCCVVSGLTSQELSCPPDVTKKCYEDLNDDPVITNGQGLELDIVREFSGNNCQVFNVSNTYSLIDPVSDSIVASCVQKVIVVPFQEPIVFPQDTIISGFSIAEILNESIFLDGMFPFGDNNCNILYTYEDVVVQSYPELYIFRNWEALNWCTAEVTTARQRIALQDLPNNTIATQVEDCPGELIRIESIELSINGEEVDRAFCFRPFIQLHELMNCLADSLLVADDDVLSLRLTDIDNPLRGLGVKDLIDIQRHILGLKRFEDECRLLAADVNRDGRINGIDLVETRKMIVGIYRNWPFGDGPQLFVNGSLRDELVFNKAEFPLPKLDIVVTNQANTSTK